MLNSLVNKLPAIRLGPWTATTATIKEKQLLKKLPLKIDVAEQYIYDYNRFISAGQRGYCRLQLFFPPWINCHMITHITASFKKPRTQFFEKAKSEALFPVTVCTLTGSIEAMAESNDFHQLLKSTFNLSVLGLWWSKARTQIRGGSEYSRSRFVLHVEIDNSDLHKVDKIRDYFSHSSKKVDNNMLGIPMTFVPSFQINASDDLKCRIRENAKSQEYCSAIYFWIQVRIAKD